MLIMIGFIYGLLGIVIAFSSGVLYEHYRNIIVRLAMPILSILFICLSVLFSSGILH